VVVEAHLVTALGSLVVVQEATLVETAAMIVAFMWEATLGQQMREVVSVTVAPQEQQGRVVSPSVPMVVEAVGATMEAGQVNMPPEEEVQATVHTMSLIMQQAVA
jgi:hypothetical protein